MGSGAAAALRRAARAPGVPLTRSKTAQFAGPRTELQRSSLEVIDAGLAQGVEAASIARAARLLQAYELLYWNSLPR